MMSVSITLLILQAKTREKGNLRFVGFQVFAYPIYRVCGVILHFLKLPLDVNSLYNLVSGFYCEVGENES
jgi:hypothetical protein